MGPHSPQLPPPDLFRARLDAQINMKHPLVRLAGLIDWDEIHRTFGGHFSSGRGRPALSPRLVAGLLDLQHAFDASDEAVVGTWVENPYWQFFTGEIDLQTEAPVDPSSLTRWRKRIGEAGVETLLALTIEAARKAGIDQQDERGPRHRRHDSDAQGHCPMWHQPGSSLKGSFKCVHSLIDPG